MLKKNLICSCYFTNNIFLKRYKLHVKYTSEEDFWETYGEILKTNGCIREEDKKDVIKIINDELDRRHSNGKQSLVRKTVIRQKYKPLHPSIYHLKEIYLHKDFKSAVTYSKQTSACKDELLKKISVCKGESVYSMPVFTSDFCKLFLEEIQHFQMSDLPKGRPNTMNKRGILLEELGFYENFIKKLRSDYLMPLASLLYPDWIGESGLDSQRAFIVNYNYELDGDNTDLNIHFDNAEVTLNVSLDDNFEGGELFLGGMRKTPSSTFTKIQHSPAYGIFHRSQHLHGAMPLEDGERNNLIIWMRSSSLRNKLCPMCDLQPTLVETEGDGDGFAMKEKAVDVCMVT